MKKLFFLGVYFFTSWVSAQPASVAELDALIPKLTNQLSQGVYGVKSESKKGAMAFLTTEMCEQAVTCFGNNPGSPYGGVFVPQATGQSAISPISLPMPISVPGMTVHTPLRTDEAIVILGWTPTHLKYFGFTPYLMARSYAEDEEVQSVVFSALGDTLNHLTIRTAGSSVPGEKSFGQFTAIILTADKNAENRVREALRAQGIGASMVNTIVVPSAFPLTLGWDSKADQFSLIFRMAAVTDQLKIDTYLATNPFRVLRVTPTSQAIVSLLPTPSLRAQGTKKCETDKLSTYCSTYVEKGLVEALENASNEIIRKMAAAGVELKYLTPSLPLPYMMTANQTYGSFCAKVGKNCNGDNRDAIYAMDSGIEMLSEDPNDFMLIMGVNHVKYSKATYFSHSVYRASNGAGIGGLSDADVMVNGKSSIEHFLGRPLKSAAEAGLYAFKIARNCGGQPFCFEIQKSGPLGVPVDEKLMVVGRVYLEPSTKVKPHEHEMIIQRRLRSTP